MAKQKQKKAPRPPAKDEPHLEESVTESTEEVLRFFKTYRNPLIFCVVAIIAVFTVPGILERLEQQRRLARSNEIAAIFADENATEAAVRGKATDMLAAISGQPSEVVLAIAYADWLMDDERRDSDTALTVVTKVRERHPDNLFLKLRQEQLEFLAGDADFELPPPRPEPEPEEGSADAGDAADSDAAAEAAEAADAATTRPADPGAATPPAEGDGG